MGKRWTGFRITYFKKTRDSETANLAGRSCIFIAALQRESGIPFRAELMLKKYKTAQRLIKEVGK